VLILWLTAATGSAHYFFFFRRAAKSEPSSLPSLSTSSFFCLDDIPFGAAFLAAFLAVFFLPMHPHVAHILFTRFLWFGDFLFSRACGYAVRNLFATLSFHAYLDVTIPARVRIFCHYFLPFLADFLTLLGSLPLGVLSSHSLAISGCLAYMNLRWD